MRITSSTYHRHRGVPRGLRRLRAALACAAIVVAATPLSARAANLVIQGAGDGHGVGMSQDGALGLAQHGATYQAILAHYYAGTTLGAAPPTTVIRVLVGAHVVRVPLERYVRGVVSAEMPASWPLAALEAQAVASRTYALTSHAGGTRFDVYSDTRSQVYAGAAAETAQTNAAIADTAGQIVLYAGQPAPTYYFADSGGMTEDNENSFIGSAPAPWLRGVSDPYDGGPSTRWTHTISFHAAATRLAGLLNGSFRGIEVLTRGVSPRVVSAEVLGSRGATPVGGPELAARLGLPSTWMYFSVQRGTSVTAEPDRSGAPPTPAPATPPAPAPPSPATTSPQGGASAPGAQVVVYSRTGGAAASR